MGDTLQNGLFSNSNLAGFYDVQNGWDADFDFCLDLARNAKSVLDIGCGTGELAVALAKRRRVVGVDPAAAMLELARDRPGGESATWVKGDARDIRLGETFDLVVLTGHAFQVFLTDSDQRAVLQTIAAHLAPDGRFVFDSRNPECPGSKNRNKATTLRVIEHPEHGQVQYWNVSTYDENSGILSYTNSYRRLPDGQVMSATEHIRCASKNVIFQAIQAAGLTVESWLGDWRGARFDPTSREIIPVGRLARR